MTHDLVERLREMGSIKTSALYSQRKTLNGAADKLEAYMAEIAALRAEKEEIRKAVIEEAAAYHDDLAGQYVACEYESSHHELMVKLHQEFAAAIRNMGERT